MATTRTIHGAASTLTMNIETARVFLHPGTLFRTSDGATWTCTGEARDVTLFGHDYVAIPRYPAAPLLLTSRDRIEVFETYR